MAEEAWHCAALPHTSPAKRGRTGLQKCWVLTASANGRARRSCPVAPGAGLRASPDKCYLASLSISNETEHYVYSDVHYSCTCISDLSAPQKHSNLCRHLDISRHLIL